MELIKNNKNPFDGYLENLQKKLDVEKKKVNPVHEIVNNYYDWKGLKDKPKEFYKGRYSYGKLAREAKMLYVFYKEDLNMALWALDQVRYQAEKGGYDWSIITCLKHKLNKDESRKV